MKKRTTMLVMSLSLLATMAIPGIAAAHRGPHEPLPDGFFPGCFGKWQFTFHSSGPIPEVRNRGHRRADRNGDGFSCLKIVTIERRGNARTVALWRDNRNFHNPEEF